jgi:hypothetical protein
MQEVRLELENVRVAIDGQDDRLALSTKFSQFQHAALTLVSARSEALTRGAEPGAAPFPSKLANPSACTSERNVFDQLTSRGIVVTVARARWADSPLAIRFLE